MTEKRFHSRSTIPFPMRVIGRDIDGRVFREMSEVCNASMLGISCTLRSTVEVGTVLYVSCRMPRDLRLFDCGTEQYNVLARVCRVEPLPNGEYQIAILFIGQTPPIETEIIKQYGPPRIIAQKPVAILEALELQN